MPQIISCKTCSKPIEKGKYCSRKCYLNRQKDEIKRFLNKIDILQDIKQCWNWKASLGNGRYGQHNFQGKQWRSHRFAWFITFGSLPRNLFVLHKCDNTICCNPFHLFLGTAKDNTQDMLKKGRLIIGKRYSKLTDMQIKDIRLRPRIKGYQSKLAKELNVHQSQISRIINFKRRNKYVSTDRI